tara:strand:- start:12687 stop:12896 length:210 start_codon:yes stop_codon:yes gene_type:complete
MTKFEIACEVYDAAERAADEQYALALFLASANSLTREEKNRAIGNAEAQFDVAIRVAFRALNDARGLEI